MRHFWTDSELIFLRNNYQKMDDFELAKIMGISRISIQTKRRKLGYLRPKKVRVSDLTPQQNVILALLLKGMTYKECAEALYVSMSTIKTHSNLIFQKLEVNSLSQLLIKCLKEQIAEYEDYIQILEEQNLKQIVRINQLEIRDK